MARRLERLQRGFLWDGLGGEPKLHLVNWKTIFSFVPRGGLEVKNRMLFNKAYLVNGSVDLCKRRLLYGERWLLSSMGSRARIGVQRKFESPMGGAFRGILGMARGISPTLSPLGLGTGLVFVFGMMFVAVKLLSKLYSIAHDKKVLVSDFYSLESKYHHGSPGLRVGISTLSSIHYSPQQPIRGGG